MPGEQTVYIFPGIEYTPVCEVCNQPFVPDIDRQMWSLVHRPHEYSSTGGTILYFHGGCIPEYLRPLANCQSITNVVRRTKEDEQRDIHYGYPRMDAREWLKHQIDHRDGFDVRTLDGATYIHAENVEWAMERFALGDRPDTNAKRRN